MTTIAASAPVHSASRSQPHAFAGMGHVLRFIARRDRVRGPAWALGFTVALASTAAAVVGLYNTPEEMQSYATVALANPALKAITGRGYGLDFPTEGAIVMNEMSMFTFVGIALMCVFMVIRHTRAEEDTAQAELVRAAPVGRHAALAATMIWVSAITLLTGIGIAVGMSPFLPATGCLAFGAAVAGIGLVFVGVGAVTAQISATAGAAKATAGMVLGLMFIVRAAGDVNESWLTWVSPLGWAQGIQAFADEQWWVLLPLLGTAVVLMIASVILSARRDLGHGLLQQKSGRAEGSARLSTPLALATRLQRTSVIGWTIGIALMGFFMGIVAESADSLSENAAVADLVAQAGAGTITEQFLATMMRMGAVIVAGFTIASVLRLRTEERAIHVDPMLATPTSRPKWLWSHTTVALVGSVIIMVASGLLTGVGYALQVGNADDILALIGSGLTLAAPLFVIAGFALALVGIAPKLASFAWVGLAWPLIVAIFGEQQDIPQWARDISPFEHIPRVPAADFDIVPFAILLAVAAAFMAVGTIGIKRRDINRT